MPRSMNTTITIRLLQLELHLGVIIHISAPLTFALKSKSTGSWPGEFGGNVQLGALLRCSVLALLISFGLLAHS